MSCRPLSPHRRPSFTLYTYNIIILYICASHITLIVLAILWPSQLQIMCSMGHRTYTRVKKYAGEVPTFPKVNLLYMYMYIHNVHVHVSYFALPLLPPYLVKACPHLAFESSTLYTRFGSMWSDSIHIWR